MFRLRLLLALVLTFPLFAQVNGRLTGTVLDPSGAPVPAAKVEVFLGGGASAVLTTQTNQEGLFTFSALRPESYDVSITTKGFARLTMRSVKVDALSETSLGAIKLEVATAKQVVEIIAETAGVQLGGSELVSTIQRQQVQNLPTASRQL